jgi:hypothetical protein
MPAQDVLAALEQQGAHTITFNPLTPLMIAKALQRIAGQQGFALPADIGARTTSDAPLWLFGLRSRWYCAL